MDFAFGLFGGLVVGFCGAFLFISKIVGKAVGETLVQAGFRPRDFAKSGATWHKHG